MSAVFPSTGSATTTRSTVDVAVVCVGAALMLCWDALGWDRGVSHWFGDSGGFFWRDSWIARSLLHQGGRALAWCGVAVLLVHCVLPLPLISTRQARTQRIMMLAMVLFCMVWVPMLKQFSATSCPWDLQEFGGVARYVSHWEAMLSGTRDGGPGRCFPSGHAVAAFGFLPVYFSLRHEQPLRARVWLRAIVLCGVLFGFTQLVRGAHYVSHTLWSAWWCWLVAAGAASGVIRRWPIASAR
jgi:membrane-associated PAP2 superfamily phosphatase